MSNMHFLSFGKKSGTTSGRSNLTRSVSLSLYTNAVGQVSVDQMSIGEQYRLHDANRAIILKEGCGFKKKDGQR